MGVAMNAVFNYWVNAVFTWRSQGKWQVAALFVTLVAFAHMLHKSQIYYRIL